MWLTVSTSETEYLRVSPLLNFHYLLLYVLARCLLQVLSLLFPSLHVYERMETGCFPSNYVFKVLLLRLFLTTGSNAAEVDKIYLPRGIQDKTWASMTYKIITGSFRVARFSAKKLTYFSIWTNNIIGCLKILVLYGCCTLVLLTKSFRNSSSYLKFEKKIEIICRTKYLHLYISFFSSTFYGFLLFCFLFETLCIPFSLFC